MIVKSKKIIFINNEQIKFNGERVNMYTIFVSISQYCVYCVRYLCVLWFNAMCSTN